MFVVGVVAAVMLRHSVKTGEFDAKTPRCRAIRRFNSV